MGSNDCPPFLRTDDEQKLWRDKQIQGLDPFFAYTCSSSSLYLAVDSEGQDGCSGGVTSIGLSFLPVSTLPVALPSRPLENATLDTAVFRYGIKSWSLYIDGRYRGRMIEPFRYGNIQRVALSELEHCVASILEECAQTAKRQEKRLTLIGWAIESEVKAITALFQRLLSKFDSWIDLAAVASYMSGIQTNKRRSLRDTLLTLGFANGYSVQHLQRAHDPGMDATRTVAAMIALAASPVRRLHIPQWSLEEKEARKKLTKRPARDVFPYAIRISTQDGSPMLRSVNDVVKLEEFIKVEYDSQIAVAICPPGKPEGGKTHGWACFGSLPLMICFVQRLEGHIVDGIGLKFHIDGPAKL